MRGAKQGATRKAPGARNKAVLAGAWRLAPGALETT